MVGLKEENTILYAITEAPDVFFLSFSQFEDNSSMNANEHIETFDFVMDLYQLETPNLIALVKDNMETNQCNVRRLNIPFVTLVGCELVDESKFDAAKKVSAMMTKLCSVKRWGKAEIDWLSCDACSSSNA
ncbi:hypothetical protein PsorP6_000785 [Peronosclerospora sorghi]|uniref:Uncharacterized protein n=1 Tax=Peronosclerospora sorghi TaxID=230839 RepID=A0ACC0WR26_9STRA|nr:hypothetical protein PsorP6_000785 [Peronosclerospora sorghi]